MDTKTKNTIAAQINLYAKQTGLDTAIDFETRLMLADAGMQAKLAHNHGIALAEAQAAVQMALFEVDALPAVDHRFTPHPVLKAAGDLIRERGWAKGKYVAPGGAVCASYAVTEATRGLPDDRACEARDELLNRIAAEFGEALSIPMWNDSRANVDDVLRLMY